MPYKKKHRLTLKQHLEAQYLRGQGNPSERPILSKHYRHKGRPREYQDDTPSVTLADVWPTAD